MSWRRLAFALTAALPLPALAIGDISVESGNALPKSRLSFESDISEKEPVLLAADTLYYDQENEIVVAAGKVEVSQGGTILLADQLLYDRKRDTVVARGNISMLEVSGHVYFAEEIELKNAMKTGLVNQFKARLSDNSLFAAARGERVDENIMKLDKAVYSPCKVCVTKAQEEGSDPQWQIRADRITIDQDRQKVLYDNTTFEMYGVPVFYTPWFSHPTPGADNQSGLLLPEYAHNDNLGSVYKIPVYYAIAPDKDVTITPIYTSSEGVVMAGEYRQAFDSGRMQFDGSITRPEDRDAQGLPTSGQQIRGHINANGMFTATPNTDWGFDIHRASDDTYLRRYNWAEDTLLTSKIYAQTFNFGRASVFDTDRSYASAQGLYFQGLTAQDNQNTIPMVLPLASVKMETQPGWNNSRFYIDGNLMALARDLGAGSRRLSATTGWRLPYITDDGQIIEFSTEIRGDFYSVEDVLLEDGTQFDGTTGRLVPQASVTWRYPFISRGQGRSFLIEPVVNFAISPGGGNPDEIPNEDSLVPEFTDTNLFSPNRFAGYDLIESGPRVSYGLRGQVQLFSDSFINWLVGQHYRVNNDRSFPFSNDLDSHLSDYVGKVGLDWQPVYLAYRFRLERESLAAKRNEIEAGFNYSLLSMSASYLSLQNDPVLDNKEQVAGNASLKLTDEWILTFNANRDLLANYLVSTGLGLTYQNECTNLTTIMGRQYTRDRDIKPSTSVLVRISLKNLN